MDYVKILLIIWILILLIIYIILFQKILCFFKHKKILINYFFDYLDCNSNRSTFLCKDSSRNILENFNDDLNDKISKSIESSKISKRELKNHFMLNSLSNYYYIFSLIKPEKSSPFVISKLLSLYIMIFSYLLITHIVILCFLQDFHEEKDIISFIFLMTFVGSFLILIVNIILVQFFKGFALSSNTLKPTSSVNSHIFDFFLLICNLTQTCLLFFSFYILIIEEKEFISSILYFIIIALILESFFLRVFWNLLIFLFNSFFQIFRKTNMSEIYWKEIEREKQEKRLQNIISNYINPHSDLFLQGKENLNPIEELHAKTIFDFHSNRFDYKEEIADENSIENQSHTENVKNFDGSKIQLAHKHNNNKFVLAKRIHSQNSPQKKKKYNNFEYINPENKDSNEKKKQAAKKIDFPKKKNSNEIFSLDSTKSEKFKGKENSEIKKHLNTDIPLYKSISNDNKSGFLENTEDLNENKINNEINNNSLERKNEINSDIKKNENMKFYSTPFLNSENLNDIKIFENSEIIKNEETKKGYKNSPNIKEIEFSELQIQKEKSFSFSEEKEKEKKVKNDDFSTHNSYQNQSDEFEKDDFLKKLSFFFQKNIFIL